MKYDLQMCYKVIHNQICVLNDDFLVFAVVRVLLEDIVINFTRVIRRLTHKYVFTNGICDIWNALPSSAVEASSLTVFKRLLDHVDLARYCIDIR